MLYLVGPEHPVLWRHALDIKSVASQVDPYLADIARIMTEKKLMGLAAPQIGISYRFFVIRSLIFINPTITQYTSPIQGILESCSTEPNNVRNAMRYDKVVAVWKNQHGITFRRTLTGKIGQLFQHMNDHLHGKCVFPDPAFTHAHQQHQQRLTGPGYDD